MPVPRPYAIRRLFPLAVTLALFIACGDDPSGPDDGDGDIDPPGETIPAEERIAAIAAVEAQVETLSAQHPDGEARAEAIAAYLETRSEFREVGVDTADHTVWAIFTDGRGLIISDNLALGADTFTAAPRRSVQQAAAAASRARARATSGPGGAASRVAPTAIDPVELPVSRQARLLSTFNLGYAFGDGARETQILMEEMLDSAGWDVTRGGPEASDVAALRAVSGDGFFYLNTHGDAGATFDGVRLPTFAFQTSQIVTLQSEVDSATQADLDAGRLVYMTAQYSGVAEDSLLKDTRYAITPKFVEHYMSFSEGAFVLLSVCWSANANAEPQAMVSALRAKGASVVVGWTRPVNAWDAWHAARFLTDRMTGANRYEPEPSPHRPFPLQPVVDYMGELGIDKSNPTDKGTAMLTVMGPTSGAGFGLLRPTIERVQIDTLLIASPAGALMIYGDFGSDPGEANRRVFVRDGSEVNLTVFTWTPDSIRALPVTDEDEPGFYGDVVVESRGRPSNPRRLHAWYGTATYLMDAIGSLEVRAEMDVVARFDADSVRTAPGEPAQANDHVQVFRVQPYPEIEARWLASGEAQGQDCTMTWAGSGTVESSQIGGNQSYLFQAALDPQLHEFTLRHLILQDMDGYTVTCDGSAQAPVSVSSLMFLQQSATDAYLRFDVDEQWRAVADEIVLPGDETTLTFNWPEMLPMPAYDPAQPK